MEEEHSVSEDTKENLNSVIMMENEMVAVEEALKIEVGEVKIETADCDSGLFTVGQSFWEFANKDDSHGNSDKIISSRIKNEHKHSKAWMKCYMQDGEAVEMQPANIKLEKDLDILKLEVKEITEELILKDEDYFDTSIDENSEIVLKRISNECEVEDGAKVTPTAFINKIEKSIKIGEMNLEMLMDMENCQDIDAAHFSQNHSSTNAKPDILMKGSVFSCFNCNYTAFHKDHLINHMEQHKDQKNADLHSSRHKHCICMHCHARFKSKVSLDNHTNEKHPDSIASISDKIHKCTHCTYAATSKSSLARHMLKHPEIADTCKLNTCIHCNATFKRNVNLDNHTIRKHPDFVTSFSSKTHKSTRCTYKTTRKDCLLCINCNATFKSKISLDDHTIKKHPDFIASVSTKIHECPQCTYATTMTNHLARHMLNHYETAGSYKLNTCIHCNATFKSKVTLDNHTIRKHPDFIASVSRTIHKCLHCTYATTFKNILARHMLKHPEATGSYKLSTCIHCNATFKSKQKLDEHTIREHPDFIASVSSKIHKCSHCTFATTINTRIASHIKLKHPEIAGSSELSTCIHCNATFVSKISLDDHTIRKHPDFIASISSKIHKCLLCTYTTTVTSSLARHMLKHPETVGNYKLSTCMHCNATFNSKLYLDDHTIKKHPNFSASVSTKIHKCSHCTYATTLKTNIERHMLKHPETAEGSKVSTCIHCNVTLRSSKNLDNHIIKKHPDFIASVSRKIYECTHCTYKTVNKRDLTRHILIHPETSGSGKSITCIHCNATFKNKRNLDYHTVSKHPDFIASVSGKIHKCTRCTYTTMGKVILARHILKHSETAGSKKLNTCIHCNATFANKVNLDDHTVKKHPDLIATVCSKIHKCSLCTYATTFKNILARHMLKHPEATEIYKLSTCIHCNATFISKQRLDDHTIRKHPDFIASVSSKIHKCSHCTYATTINTRLDGHIKLKHPEIAGSSKLSTCIHCNATFVSKINLDDHTVRKHPDFIASVSSKIHKCLLCTYTTTVTSNFARHMLKHPETVGNYKLSTCIHCNATFKSNQALDDHTIKKHPNFSASVSRKIHKCPYCTYATTLKTDIDRHMLKHPETAEGSKLGTCIHCNVTFRSYQTLDDHIIKKHPDFIASISRKIHECTHCTYKTVYKRNFTRHILKHPETSGSCKRITCIHCNVTFKSKRNLDAHRIRKHPDFIASVSGKIHKCTRCTYTTKRKVILARHLLKHPETAGS